MADFYQQAELVIAWVGEDYGSGAKVLELFSRYTEGLRILESYAKHSSNEQTSGCNDQNRDLEMESLEKAMSDIFGSHNSDAISNFFSRLWFERRWVIQEVMSAKDALIQCGSRTMRFNTFVNAACKILVRCPGPHENPLDPGLLVDRHTINRLRAMKTVDLYSFGRGAIRPPKSSHSRPLLSLLETFQASQCSDDRDRIYALAGLSDDIRQEHYVKPHRLPHPLRPKMFSDRSLPLVVNYADDVENIYTDLAISMLEKFWYRPERVLKCASAFRNEISASSGLPSWVPDWRAESCFKPLHTKLEIPDDLDSDWGSVSADKKILHMKGWHHSVLSQRIGGLVGTSSFEELKRVMKQWWNFYSSFHNEILPPGHASGVTGDEIFLSDKQDSFFHVATLGSFMERNKKIHSRRFLRLVFDGDSDFRTLPLGDDSEGVGIGQTAEVTTAGQSGSLAIMPTWKLNSIREEIEKVIEVIRGRAMCKNRNGELMVCPEDAKDGDTIVILKEAKTPFIIRPVTKGFQATFRLIGDCYVEGMQVEMGSEVEQRRKYGRPSIFQIV